MPTLFFLLFQGFFTCISSLKDTYNSHDGEEEALKKLETIAVDAFDNIPMIHSDVKVIVDLLKRGECFPLHTLKNHAIVQASKFSMKELQVTKKFVNMDFYHRSELEPNNDMSYQA